MINVEIFLMPQYKTHNFFNCVIALPILAYGLIHFFNPPLKYFLAFSLSFVYGTFFMNPDLDLTHQIKLFSFRGLLTIPFRSYSYFFKHRGISHVIFMGTITRIAWLVCFIWLLGYFIEFSLFNQKNLFHMYVKYKDFALYGFFGILAADICHLFLDMKS